MPRKPFFAILRDTAMKLGASHPMGPLALGDLVGLDIVLAIMEVLQNETGDSKPTSFILSAGLKKCMPIIGRSSPAPISVMEREEVLVAKMHSGFTIS